MKTTRLTPFVYDRLRSYEQGEINILLGEDAADNLYHSLALAGVCASSGKFDHIVYLNFPFSKRRFAEAERSVSPTSPDVSADPKGAGATSALRCKMTVYHLATGRTSERLHALKNNDYDFERTALIINAWELASPHYRYRQELIFALRELQMELGMTVFVFATVRNPAGIVARQVNRFGKLSLAADKITSLIEEDLPAVAQASTPAATQGKESEKLTSSNSNDLAHAQGHLSGSESIEAPHRVSAVRKKEDDIEAKMKADRKKLLEILPALEEEAKRTGVLRLTIDQTLALTEKEENEIFDKYEIETIREPKKHKSVNLTIPNFNDLTQAGGCLQEVENEEMAMA